MAVLSFLLRATAWAPVLLLLILILATTTTRAQRFDCTSDSCVDRSSFVIKVIVHGTFEDFFWQGIKAAMEQAARDMAVQLDFDLYDTFDDFTRIPDDIRDTLNADPKPDALVVSIPDAGVEAAVKLVMDDGSIPVFGVNSGDQAAPALGLQGFVAMNERLGGQVAGENFERMIMMNNETAGGLGLYINDERESCPASCILRSCVLLHQLLYLFHLTTTIIFFCFLYTSHSYQLCLDKALPRFDERPTGHDDFKG